MIDEMKPYLIQRAKFEDRPTREGVDSVLSFDYMGSSEYEWGAIGDSLKRIRAEINSYDLRNVTDPNVITSKLASLIDEDKKAVVHNVFGDRLVLYCRSSQYTQIVAQIMALKDDKIRLKEPSYFRVQFDPRSVLPSIAELKRKGVHRGTTRGERIYLMDGEIYRVDQKTKKIRGPNDYQLSVNCWWDLAHDWIMFFSRDGRGQKLVGAIKNVPAKKPEPITSK